MRSNRTIPSMSSATVHPEGVPEPFVRGFPIGRISVIVSLALALAIELATPSAASADWLYDFNSPPGETFFVFPNYDRPESPRPPGFEYSFGDGVFTMHDDNPRDSGGTNRAKALDSEVFSSDVTVTAVINPNGETTHGWLGVVTRSSIAEPSTGYWIALNAEGGKGRLYAGKAVRERNVTRMAGSARTTTFAAPYLLRLDAINKEDYVQVVGAVLDPSSGQEIDHLEFRDYGTPQYPQLRLGSSGVFGGLFSSNLNLTFGTASSVTIPEPSTFSLITVAVFLLETSCCRAATAAHRQNGNRRSMNCRRAFRPGKSCSARHSLPAVLPTDRFCASRK